MPSVGGITWMLSAAGREPRLSGYEVIMGGGPRNVRADLATAAVLPRRWPAFAERTRGFACTTRPRSTRNCRGGGHVEDGRRLASSARCANYSLARWRCAAGQACAGEVGACPHPIVSDDCAATHGQCIFPCQKAAASAAPVLPAEQLVCSQPAPASLMRSGWPCSLAYRFAALVRPPLDQ